MQTNIALAPPIGLFAEIDNPMPATTPKNTLPHAGAFSLCMASAGEWVEIVGFIGRRGFHDRMAGIGLKIGARIHILSDPMHGKLLIDLAGTRLFLGGGMAHKIRVIRTKGEKR